MRFNRLESGQVFFVLYFYNVMFLSVESFSPCMHGYDVNDSTSLIYD